MRHVSSLALLSGIASAAIFEAEDATINGDLVIATDIAGYSGSGYVTNWDDSSDTLTFNVNGLSAGSYDISIVFSAQYGDKYTSVSVNGAATVEAALTNVTTETWATTLVGSYALTDGSNTVELEYDWGWYLIDAITVVPTAAKPIVVVNVTDGATAEAEDGILTGTTVGTSTTGYSGAGFVTGFFDATDSLDITLYSETQVLYDVIVRYAAIYGAKQTTLELNGSNGEEVILADTSTATSPWANATAGQLLLEAGNNTVTFSTDWYVIPMLPCFFLKYP